MKFSSDSLFVVLSETERLFNTCLVGPVYTLDEAEKVAEARAASLPAEQRERERIKVYTLDDAVAEIKAAAIAGY
jgi:hypothetical protein